MLRLGQVDAIEFSLVILRIALRARVSIPGRIVLTTDQANRSFTIGRLSA